MTSRRMFLVAATMVVSMTVTITAPEAWPTRTPKTPTLRIINLGAGPGSFSSAINNQGHVIGHIFTQELGFSFHAFVWQDGVLTDLGPLPGKVTTNAVAINERGHITGFSNCDPLTPLDCARAFLWRRGEMTDLGTLGGFDSRAHGLNNRSQVVGVSSNASCPFLDFDECNRAFLWEDGDMIDLGTLGGREAVAFDINDRGQIIGISLAPRAIPNEFNEFDQHAFLWQDGVMIDLGRVGEVSTPAGINARGQIIINAFVPLCPCPERAFLWDDGTRTDLGSLGGPATAAFAINRHGQVVGTSDTASGERHAFLWQNGIMIDLGTLGGGFSEAFDINSRGQVIGVSTNAAGEFRPFLWQDGVMTDLSPKTPLTRASASDINDRGKIAATVDSMAVVWVPRDDEKRHGRHKRKHHHHGHHHPHDEHDKDDHDLFDRHGRDDRHSRR
jgi:probable HAF family extracellular repeat protein